MRDTYCYELNCVLLYLHIEVLTPGASDVALFACVVITAEISYLKMRLYWSRGSL